MKQLPIVLGLDASSTTIGFCVLQGRAVLASGNLQLPNGLISVRCLIAGTIMYELIEQHAPDAVAIESPVVKRFVGKKGQRVDSASAVIPQARVSGAILAVLAARALAWQEVPPASAKKALAGVGNADKAAMMLAASAYGVSGEHAADALGVALAIIDQVVIGGAYAHA